MLDDVRVYLVAIRMAELGILELACVRVCLVASGQGERHVRIFEVTSASEPCPRRPNRALPRPE